MPPDVSLHIWIETLRARLDRGELAGLPGVDIGDDTGAVPAEWTISVMLADLDGFDDMTPEERPHPGNVRRWLNLLDDFRRLRELIG
jgi:hypothetical protein